MKLFDYTRTSLKTYFTCLSLVLIFVFFADNMSIAQTDSVNQINDSTLIDVAKIRLQQSCYKEIFFTVTAPNQVRNEEIPLLPFKPIPFSKNNVSVPASFIE